MMGFEQTIGVASISTDNKWQQIKDVFCGAEPI